MRTLDPTSPAATPLACCEHCGIAAGSTGGPELRCTCGSLLARMVAGGIELKCRRCKRAVIVPLER